MSHRIPTQRLVIELHPVVKSQIEGNLSKADDRDSLAIRADMIAEIGWSEEMKNSYIMLDFQAGIQRVTVTERPDMIFEAIDEAEKDIYARSMKAATGLTHALATKLPPGEVEDDTPS